MKKNITYIDGAKFEALLTARGITPIPQAGFFKVQAAAGRQLYIAKTKRVGRIDLSGFEVPVEMGVFNLGGEARGAVKQQVRFDLPEAEVLANFEKVLDLMLQLAPAEKVKRSALPKPAAAPKAQGWSKAVTDNTDEAMAARRALIEKVAKEKGVFVSPKAFAQADKA